ncbi:hypothetical protein BT67DRAFT_438588 [Trichocladium antarcticum]|uniref:Uncharacterized protein n=1 Tax=Trichocladium antarcticum TaxID=1450529 RepID=A0AAN6USY8_9PEZI|nr:hypothetical protein BT67DRAFT_438588 [Trichocladium antarcticum]
MLSPVPPATDAAELFPLPLALWLAPAIRILLLYVPRRSTRANGRLDAAIKECGEYPEYCTSVSTNRGFPMFSTLRVGSK